jgi:HEAT repeat protein
LWGLGQLARRDSRHAAALRRFVADADAEIRAQAARLLGEARDAGSGDALITALADESPRVRSFAAEALGRIGDRRAVAAIVAMLAANADQDAYLGTAGCHALASIGDGDALVALATHASAAVRIAAVVALRRLKHPGIAAFVNDADPLVAVEAARAINDEGGIAAALPALAGRLSDATGDEAFLRRAISANLRLGDAAAARRMAAFAADATRPGAMRLEAVLALGVWPDPSRLDRVDGAWIGALPGRDVDSARVAAGAVLRLLDDPGTAPELKVAVLGSATSLGVTGTQAHALRRLEQDVVPEVRIAALAALQSLGGAEAEAAVRTALGDRDAAVRMAAIDAVPALTAAPALAVAELSRIIRSDNHAISERQRAIAALGRIKASPATAALSRLVGQVPDSLPVALQLDVLQAAGASGEEELLAALAGAGAGRRLENLAARFPAALEQGGSAPRGRQLALRHPAAQCTRCHVMGEGESTVGPNLNGIGARLSRSQLREALLDPGARLAPGFDAGNGVSAMPPMGTLLKPEEIRDLVEFMASELD